MTPRLGSRDALSALYFVGLVLLTLGFLILVPEAHRSNVAWLDFAVISLIYTVNFPFLARWCIGSGNFTQRIPLLSAFLFTDPLYCSFAIGVIWWGLDSWAPFRLQLMLQLALLFIASVVMTLGWYGSEHASKVAVEERGTRSNLQGLRSAIANCEASMSGRGSELRTSRLRFEKIKEDTRYLSPSLDPSMLSFEDDLVAAVDEIIRVTHSNDPAAMKAEIASLLDRCEAIMSLRRQSATR